MDRVAVFVDAGYVFAAGSRLIASEKLSRAQLNLDYDAVLRLLGELATELTGLPLLRVYWYDGTSTGPTPQQLALAYRASVKLRLGFVNQQGQQKGVDSLIVTDLINLARNRAMADAVLVTGDEDIRVGVQQAQEFGVRVHLIGIAPARENQSGFLVQEADGVRELTQSEVGSFLVRVVPRTTGLAHEPTAATPSPATLEAVAHQLARELTLEEMAAVLKEAVGGVVPAEVDRRLLFEGSRAVGRSVLTPEEKRRIRAGFIDVCRRFVDTT